MMQSLLQVFTKPWSEVEKGDIHTLFINAEPIKDKCKITIEVMIKDDNERPQKYLIVQKEVEPEMMKNVAKIFNETADKALAG